MNDSVVVKGSTPEFVLRERHFVEEVALLLEASGLPRASGRVLGRLLVCDPAVQSSAELASYLDASGGAISTSTRQLIQVGLVQRVPGPGSRASHFAVQPDALDRLMAAELARSAMARELMDRGLALYAGAPASRTARLRRMRGLFAFFEREMPALIERWQRERELE
jgi:DNA-binding MarR family transcriptional regulator